MARLPWFEDFNDYAVRPPAAAEDPPAPPDEAPDPRAEAWTEGFLAGCQSTLASTGRQSHAMAAEITRRVVEIEDNLAAMADQSAATMGGLLLDLLLASDSRADRLEQIVAAIRPIFALEPRLHISPAVPGEVSFRDLPALCAAIETGEGELAVRWHQAGAGIGPQALSAPLGAGEGGAGSAQPAGTKAVSSAPDEG